jgi:UDP-N-acetylglucosamine 2-epimerase (non-hydrolysing)
MAMSDRVKIVCVLGTRPEGIKLAPVIRELRSRPDRFDLHVCSTGQHRQMLDQVLELFAIRPDTDLRVMGSAQSPGAAAGLILQRLDPVLAAVNPDWMLVQGDTTTVAAAALAGFYRRIKVGHVEAGLRSNNRWEPFPEEINRRVATILTERHFAPTPASRANLLREGIKSSQIVLTGNTGIDALQWAVTTQVPENAKRLVPNAGRKLVLVTVHRRENLGAPLNEILSALKILANQFKDEIQVLLPVHLNPQVQAPVRSALGGLKNVTLTAPLDYRSLIYALERCTLVMTDSGGIQEEAPALGKPVLVLRNVTERPEAVAAGTARLVGTRQETIVAETERLLLDPDAGEAMRRAGNPFGDGHAAERIVASLAGETVAEFTPESAETVTALRRSPRPALISAALAA